MPPKKAKKPRKKREPKKGLKQKQKQKQVVNVQVSSGGGGGSGYIPIPQAPEINYSLLSQLLRPANVVDVPIREAAPMAESIATRAAETQTLAEDIERPRRQPVMSESESSLGGGGFMSADSLTVKPARSDKGKARGSYKEKAVIEGRNVQNEFALGGGRSFGEGVRSGAFQEPIGVPSSSRFSSGSSGNISSFM